MERRPRGGGVDGPAQGSHDLGRLGVLQHVRGGTLRHGLLQPGMVGPGREQDHGGRRWQVQKPGQGVDPVQHRHGHVEQHHVRGQPLGGGQPLLPVGRLPDHGEAGVAVEQARHTGTHGGVVVDDQHPDGHRGGHGWDRQRGRFRQGSARVPPGQRGQQSDMGRTTPSPGRRDGQVWLPVGIKLVDLG
jgi:hypothetical protein